MNIPHQVYGKDNQEDLRNHVKGNNNLVSKDLKNVSKGAHSKVQGRHTQPTHLVCAVNGTSSLGEQPMDMANMEAIPHTITALAKKLQTHQKVFISRVKTR